jgi:hypothetical protein
MWHRADIERLMANKAVEPLSCGNDLSSREIVLSEAAGWTVGLPSYHVKFNPTLYFLDTPERLTM